MSRSVRHIPFATLVDLVDGRIAPSQRDALEAHLRICPRCTADREWYSNISGLLRAGDLADAPPPVLERAIGVFKTRPKAKQPGTLRRIIAVLSFDSGLPQPVLGVRSALPGARQMLFDAEPFQLDVRVARAGDDVMLSGQVLGPCDGGEVVLRGPQQASARLNELCEWVLPAVPVGVYELVLRVGEAEVSIANLGLEA